MIKIEMKYEMKYKINEMLGIHSCDSNQTTQYCTTLCLYVQRIIV